MKTILESDSSRGLRMWIRVKQRMVNLDNVTSFGVYAHFDECRGTVYLNLSWKSGPDGGEVELASMPCVDEKILVYVRKQAAALVGRIIEEMPRRSVLDWSDIGIVAGRL